jgi:hypothetical protein
LIQEAHRALSNVKKEKHAKMHHKHIPKTWDREILKAATGKNTCREAR